jgi:macrolide transport system ATP-binding/permease protein
MSIDPFLRARDVVKSFGDSPVLDGVSLSVFPGQRVGLVGANGVGKSTLLRLLAGVEEPDAGEVRRPADCGFLLQELPYPLGTTVCEVVADALAEIRAARTRLEQLTEELAGRPDDRAVLADYGDLLEWAQDHDLWDADRRADLMLAGLGLSNVDTDRPLSTLSGGQRSRLGLAALLIRQPRALLLDEPTNHLDDEAVGFLEGRLRGLPGVVVLASHDRVLLDEVCTDIVDLDPTRHTAHRIGGTYTDYLHAKRLERLRWEEQYVSEQEELRHLREVVTTTAREVNHGRTMKDNNKMAFDRHGGRVQKQISRRVRNARHRLDELAGAQVRKPPVPLAFAAPLTGEAAPPTGKPAPDEPAVSLREVTVAGRLRLGHLDVPASGRLLVTGPNGAGKSTLLKVLAGRLSPDSGDVWHARGVRVGLLEQDTRFTDDEATPRQLYAVAAGHGTVSLTQLGLLPARDLDRPVGQLSTGQRRRLALALLVGDPPDVLLLDEPTNHLSIDLVEELEDALRSAPGGVVVASHDRWLRRGWDGPELPLVDGRIAVMGAA